jgi:hypothetical protein
MEVQVSTEILKLQVVHYFTEPTEQPDPWAFVFKEEA